MDPVVNPPNPDDEDMVAVDETDTHTHYGCVVGGRRRRDTKGWRLRRRYVLRF